MIYVAHPIDSQGVHEPPGLREMLAGLDVYWPQDKRRSRALEDISQHQRTKVAEAAAVIAYLPEGVPTYGVPVEIEMAVRVKPVLIVRSGVHRCGPSAQIADWVSKGAKLVYWNARTEEGNRAQLAAWLIDNDLPETYEPKKQETTQSNPALELRYRAHQNPAPRWRDQLTRTHDDDAGFDLAAARQQRIEPHAFFDVACGFDIEMPEGTWGYLCARSSTIRRGLLVNPAVIDGGYRGPMFVSVWNLGDTAQIVEAGERLAQLIPIDLVSNQVKAVLVHELTPSSRGSAGFGSTGR